MIDKLTPEQEQQVKSFLYALNLITAQTGYGSVSFEVVKGQVAEFEVKHKIQPDKFPPLKRQNVSVH